MTTMTGPATEKQTAFIAKLLPSRSLPLLAGAKLEAELAEGVSKKRASEIIEILLAAPKSSAQVVKAAKAEVECGYYAYEGTVAVVVIAKTTGNKYAKKLVLPDYAGGKAQWLYAPGVVVQLAGQTPMSLEQAKEFGKLHGYCVKCGAQLTDPVSVEAGIGPVCAKSF